MTSLQTQLRDVYQNMEKVNREHHEAMQSLQVSNQEKLNSQINQLNAAFEERLAFQKVHWTDFSFAFIAITLILSLPLPFTML